MELKQQLQESINVSDLLLIVPYGIETEELMTSDYVKLSLLIVPYGIETIASRL